MSIEQDMTEAKTSAPTAKAKRKRGRPPIPTEQLAQPRRMIRHHWAYELSRLTAEERGELLAEQEVRRILSNMMFDVIHGLCSKPIIAELKPDLPGPEEIVSEAKMPLPDLTFQEVREFIKKYPLVASFLPGDLEIEQTEVRSYIRDSDFDDQNFARFGLRTRLVKEHYERFVTVVNTWCLKFKAALDQNVVEEVAAEHNRIQEEHAEYWRQMGIKPAAPAYDPSTGIDAFEQHNISVEEKVRKDREREAARHEEKEQAQLREWNSRPRHFFPESI